MNLGMDFRRGLQALPNALEALVARINTVWRKQHKDDGTHGAVTAATLTVKGLTHTGALQVEGPLTDIPLLPPGSGRVALEMGLGGSFSAPTPANRIMSRKARPVPGTASADFADLDVGARIVRFTNGAGGQVFANQSSGAITCTPELNTFLAGIFNGRVQITSDATPDSQLMLTGANPRLSWFDTAAPVDARIFRINNTAQTMSFRAVNDAQTGVLATPLALNRFGDASIGRFLAVSGGQIVFPPVQNPSADPNTLDDYEEGTWLPVWTFSVTPGAPTYAFQQGNYIKIGRLVFAFMNVGLSNLGGATGQIGLAGLPFSAVGGGGFMNFYAGTVGLTGGLDFFFSSPTILTPTTPQAGGSAAIGHTNFTNTTQVVASFTYLSTS